MTKILHFSDVHGDAEMLQIAGDFAKTQNLEVCVCSGDLLGPCLSPEEGKKVHGAYNFLVNVMQQNDMEGKFDKILSQLRFHPKCPEGVQRAIGDYTSVVAKFQENAKIGYEKLAELISKFPGKILIVPGNWDSRQFLGYLGQYNLHKCAETFKDIKFAGYGDSPEGVVVVAPREIVGFSGEEMFEFLAGEKPEIAVTHVPPFKFHDKLAEGRHSGNPYLLAHLRADEAPKLLLCGHVHDARGSNVVKETDCVVVNPGNLGRYEEGKPFGTFAVIEYEKGVTSITPYMIRNGRVSGDPEPGRYSLESENKPLIVEA